MKLIMDLLIALGGVAVFMYGMKVMSQGMEQGAGPGVRSLFKKIDKNRAVDYGIGIGVTAIVQSSSATSIMVVGLANAGVVNVRQGSGIILGAKVGTTLTAFLFALGHLSNGGFNISALFMAMAFVGVIIIFTTDNDSYKKLALFLIGFGMLFVGLEVMESAIGGKDSMLSAELTKLFRYEIMGNPFLLVLLGVLFTCIIQSSTAATGIFLTFLATGVISTLDQSFFLIMGANIGTCMDGIMASFGTNANGKRIALFHVLSSTIGAVAFSIILAIFRTPIINMFESFFKYSSWSLATYNLAYNFIYTLILLAFLNPLVDFVTRTIEDKQSEEDPSYSIDERLLKTPTIAIDHALNDVSRMSVLAMENLDRAFDGLIKEDTSQSKKIASGEYEIDALTRTLASFFIKISSTSISSQNDKLIGGLHHVIDDIERIGDHAVLLAKETYYMIQNEARFLDESKTELQEIYLKITEMFALSHKTFETRRTENLKSISAIHQEIIDSITRTRDSHIKRLSAGMYSVEVSKSVYAVLSSFHRVADHIVNIAFSIGSDTGSKTEAFANLQNKKHNSKGRKSRAR